MTQEEIIEYNKRCAEFLGGVYEIMDAPLAPQWFDLPFSKRGIPEGLLKFHSDWNWIMEVVEAIEKLKYLVVIQSNFCQIQEKGKEDNSFKPLLIACLYGNSKKEAVVEAINQFLIWYEKNKS